ncbi:hypothetical protein FGO68_gene15643 [Halteria grandinella]|uniref:Uncharacterized protein n=1 Tax=Halteria grandinella TaxID=5974 RepID=A0A8J8T9D1_HALGN|nr:hypothetical protein FGO68_gene15643 [Halteria grandinella]
MIFINDALHLIVRITFQRSLDLFGDQLLINFYYIFKHVLIVCLITDELLDDSFWLHVPVDYQRNISFVLYKSRQLNDRFSLQYILKDS